MRFSEVSTASKVAAIGFAVLSLVLFYASLSWEYSRDTPLLNYVGWMIWEHGDAPYRDVFETSMPGTLGFHALVSGLGLTGNVAFILLAIVIVTGFAVLGALAILPFGPAGSLIAAPLIVCAMFTMGPGWILKIDMVALLPISATLCLAVWQRPHGILWRQFWIGLLFGVAGTMKPHLMLGAPVVVLAAYAIEHWTGRWRDLPLGALVAQIAISLVGFAVPMALVALWLVSSGAWGRFVFVLTDYLPLHLEKTDWQEFLAPDDKQRHNIAMTRRLGNNYPFVPLAGLAVLLGLWRWRSLTPRQGILLGTLCLLAGFYGLAPGLGGQFYIYYYFPFFFFALLLIAVFVSLVEGSLWRPGVKVSAVSGVMAALLVLGASYFSVDTVFRNDRLKTVSDLEQALVRWVPEGGRVQPIDWTSGAVHAMLRQDVLPATPYLYDYHFHHHVGSQINNDLRRTFMTALQNAPPEVFLELSEYPRVSGLNTSERFPARDAFLLERYRVVEQTADYTVYLRRDLPGS